MKNSSDLKKQLSLINGKSYSLYKTICDQYKFNNYILSIDHVQGDPFASPSKIRIIIKQTISSFPYELFNESYKKIALQDHLIRLFYSYLQNSNTKTYGSGKSGIITISRCDAEIIERTAIIIDKEKIEVRFNVGFPAKGRSILSSELIKIFFEFIPKLIDNTLIYPNLNKEKIQKVIALSEDQNYIRKKLKELNLSAFIANGSILPRKSGISTKPLLDSVKFKSPKSLEIELTLPNKGKITGMAIKNGITLIVGGGYHGKSTLLKAIELGVYNHIEGDGREYVITDESALKIRSEDGRYINNTDISLFINNLPNKKDTKKFISENASGSTSQAANIIEGIEADTSLLLIDEDTSATNFMNRDNIMQTLISKEKEPITPFIERICDLYKQLSISSILVIGSCSDYFRTADTIIQMDSYIPYDVTEKAKSLINDDIEKLLTSPINIDFNRKISKNFIPSSPKGIKIKTCNTDELIINRDSIDLKALEQLIDCEQLNALGCIIQYANKYIADGRKNLQQIASEIINLINNDGLLAISSSQYGNGNLSAPRIQEIIFCFNRYRKLKIIHN